MSQGNIETYLQVEESSDYIVKLRIVRGVIHVHVGIDVYAWRDYCELFLVTIRGFLEKAGKDPLYLIIALPNAVRNLIQPRILGLSVACRLADRVG